MSETKTTTASVKVMLSYDYCHFETVISVENESGLTMKDIDETRKNCQRLSDKAVAQYKIAKSMTAKRIDGEYKIQNFESQVNRALSKPSGEITINEVAMIEQYQDEDWRSQFEVDDYDYEDDDENLPF